MRETENKPKGRVKSNMEEKGRAGQIKRKSKVTEDERTQKRGMKREGVRERERREKSM